MILRATFPDLNLVDALPFLDEITMNRFRRFPPQYNQIFRVMPSTRSMEQTSEISPLGLFTMVGENSPVRYDSSVPGFAKNYIHSQYALGYRISRLMLDDDKYGVAAKLASDLGRSAQETVELAASTVLNLGFDGANQPGPDGKALFAIDHPMPKSGGTQANTLSVQADLDVSSLELALTLGRTMVDYAGKKIRIPWTQLVVPPQSEFLAAEILGGSMRSDTANNTINAFRKRSGFGPFESVVVYDYLTDPDSWYVLASKEDHELRFYWREKFNTVHDIDFETRAAKTAGWMRFSVGFSSFYGAIGVQGA